MLLNKLFNFKCHNSWQPEIFENMYQEFFYWESKAFYLSNLVEFPLNSSSSSFSLPLGLSYFSEIPLMIFHSIQSLKALYRRRSGIEARRRLLNRISRKLSRKVEYEMRFRRLWHHYLNYNFASIGDYFDSSSTFNSQRPSEAAFTTYNSLKVGIVSVNVFPGTRHKRTGRFKDHIKSDFGAADRAR